MDQRSAAEQQALAQKAGQVARTLADAGLPVHETGNSAHGTGGEDRSGAIVYFSAVADDSAGVYVIWREAPTAVAQVRAALLGGSMTPAARAAWTFLAHAQDAMIDAVVTILRAGGWTAGREDVGGSDHVFVS